MSLIGTVISVEGEWITVEVGPLAGCQGCHACGGLLTGGEVAQPRRLSALRQGFDLAAGDRVTLDTNPGEVSLAAVIIFGLPLAGFFLGLWVTPTWLTSPGATPADWHHALGGGLGILGAALVVYLGSRAGWFTRLSLKVTGKLPPGSCPGDRGCSDSHSPP